MTTPPPKPEPEIPEELKDVPRGDGGIELEGKETNLPETIGGVMGFGEKDMYSVIERSEFQEWEIPLMGQVIHQAEHGIGSPPALDRPLVWLGEWVVKQVRMRRSKNRASSGEFERIMAAWINYLRAKDDEKQRQNQKMVGAG